MRGRAPHHTRYPAPVFPVLYLARVLGAAADTPEAHAEVLAGMCGTEAPGAAPGAPPAADIIAEFVTRARAEYAADIARMQGDAEWAAMGC